MKNPDAATLSSLSRLFYYDERLGALCSYRTAQPIRHNNGRYFQVRCPGGPTFVAQLVVWWLCTGAWPQGVIDHRDGNGLNNRFTNLRVGTQSLNMQNVWRAKRSSKTGLLGVVPHREKFRAMIGIGKKRLSLGVFPTAEAAHAAYLAAKRKHHPFNQL